MSASKFTPEQQRRIEEADRKIRERAQRKQHGMATKKAFVASADTLMTCTFDSLQEIFAQGGSGDWRLDVKRAEQCKWLVECRGPVNYQGPEPIGSAFLVGKISFIATAVRDPNRSLVKVSEYAVVDIPNLWPGYQNFVHYTTMKALGIDPTRLTFRELR